MPGTPYIPFEASRRHPVTATRVGDIPDDEQIEVSLYLKPRDVSMAAAAGEDARGALRKARSVAHQDDIKLVTAFAATYGLTVISTDPARRLVRLAGSAAKVQAAFRTALSYYHDGKQRFRARSGVLSLPEDLAAIVESVLGLDTRPQATPRLKYLPSAEALPGYRPNQVAGFYSFPTSVTGEGECIALIELGGGFTASDTQAAFQEMNLAPPEVVAVPVDGAANKPTPDDGADGEVALDIQVAGGVAPGAKIAVYFAPNTDAGFVDAVTMAAHDTTNNPSIISISWGGPEGNWTAQAMQTMTNALQDAASVNVSVFVAAGDNLATDGLDDGKAHVDFPASSPWAIGCGGTRITVSNGAITAEAVWNDGNSGTGGGISDVYPVPQFQSAANLPASVNDGYAGRGVPDVAGDAAPGSGYNIVVSGQKSVVGGTSAVAPLWAGLTALINEGAGKPVGFFLPQLYADPSVMRQVTQGNNMPSGSSVGYDAGAGWNACTGLGVPQGQALFEALTQTPPAQSAAAQPPSPQPVATASPVSAPSSLLAKIDHIVVLMLENRSFDHMLGFLYAESGNVSPAGHAFDGLTGTESNPGASGKPVQVFKIDPSAKYAYFTPGADPGEGFSATNSQLYDTIHPPAGAEPANQGFVKDFTYTLGWEKREKWSILPGTTAPDIMGIFTPDMLPVLSGLAKGYAVSDQWFASAPTETMPNRAFVCAGTSQGHMDDKTKTFTCPSIFGALGSAGIAWKIYGYDAGPLTRHDFPDITNAAEDHFGLFTDFKNDAAAGMLPAYAFLEPSWEASGNSQHPNYDVAKGEQLIHDVYHALSTGPNWNRTLLVVTYDEHGGCYDHVPPPSTATPPDSSAGEYGFDFTRFGPRVPTVFVSPLIEPGTVIRAPANGPPFDHTSILKTIEMRWGLQPLTARDAAAPDFGTVLTLTTPRTDDPLSGIVVPVSGVTAPNANDISHLQQIHAELVAALPIPEETTRHQMDLAGLKNSDQAREFIRERTEAWKAARLSREAVI